jgi:hypothetical protein
MFLAIVSDRLLKVSRVSLSGPLSTFPIGIGR